MNELTVIISFLNEGGEVETTLKEIRRTAGGAVDVIMINDASTDGFDYSGVAVKYNARYVENQMRQGCASSREIGVRLCRTPYLLIIDGHMRFYNDNWWIEIVKAIKDDPRAIYCTRCRMWDFEEKKEKGTMGYGACLKLLDSEKRGILDVTWINRDIHSRAEIVDIPCVLGASYAASKEYWNYLRGVDGLMLYGCDEAYISLKAWMEGGRCRLVNNVTIGHLFRKKFPYAVNYLELFYNKLFIAETILPESIARPVIKAIKAVDYVNYAQARELMEPVKGKVDEFREYYASVFKGGYDRFSKINEWFIAELTKKSQLV